MNFPWPSSNNDIFYENLKNDLVLMLSMLTPTTQRLLGLFSVGRLQQMVVVVLRLVWGGNHNIY